MAEIKSIRKDRFHRKWPYSCSRGPNCLRFELTFRQFVVSGHQLKPSHRKINKRLKMTGINRMHKAPSHRKSVSLYISGHCPNLLRLNLILYHRQSIHLIGL